MAALWFTEYNGADVGRVTTAGAVTTGYAGVAYGITAGNDGALWVTQPGPKFLSRHCRISKDFTNHGNQFCHLESSVFGTVRHYDRRGWHALVITTIRRKLSGTRSYS